MSLLDKLNAAKNKLKPTETSVTLEDGSQILEKRCNDGTFATVVEEVIVGPVSNRRRKKVERMKRFGFVVDLKPDLQVAKIIDGIYLGSQDAAADLQVLQSAGITHIVNCAPGVANFFPTKFNYLKLDILDLPSMRIADHFQESIHFMCLCVHGGGRVFIHCNAGISRSSTLVLAYLIKKKGFTLQEAIDVTKSARPGIRPNDGFMHQLKEYASNTY